MYNLQGAANILIQEGNVSESEHSDRVISD